MELVEKAAEDLKHLLKQGDLRVELDDRNNYKPGFKYNYWELRGVPIRIELGGRDIEKKGVTYVRRDKLGEKVFLSNENLVNDLKILLDDIHHNLYQIAKQKN